MEKGMYTKNPDFSSVKENFTVVDEGKITSKNDKEEKQMVPSVIPMVGKAVESVSNVATKAIEKGCDCHESKVSAQNMMTASEILASGEVEATQLLGTEMAKTEQVKIAVECTKDSVENIAKCAATVSENVADVQIKNAETELEYDKTLMNHIFDSDDDIETLEKKSAIYTEHQNAKTKRTMEEEKSNITQKCELIKQSTPCLITVGLFLTAGVVAIIVAKEKGRTERYRIDTDARLEYERIHEAELHGFFYKLFH